MNRCACVECKETKLLIAHTQAGSVTCKEYDLQERVHGTLTQPRAMRHHADSWCLNTVQHPKA